MNAAEQEFEKPEETITRYCEAAALPEMLPQGNSLLRLQMPAAGFLRQNAGRLIILAAITFFAYIPAIGGNYIWDDDQYVTQNHTLESRARPGPHMA